MEIIDLRRVKPPDEIDRSRRRALAPFLGALSALYGAAWRLWRSFPVRALEAGVPVVSVGSLAVGGTGKTPMCMTVAGHYAAVGRKVCILSRGYRRKVKTGLLVVSDGRRVLAGIEEAGDEPYLMAGRLDGVGVIVDRKRVASAREACARLDADILVLDDGFQYRRLRKHAEIVCLDVGSLRSGSLIPLGVLREKWSALKDEHIVVIVLRPGDRRPEAGELSHVSSCSVFYARLAASGWIDAAGRPAAGVGEQNRKYVLVSGIARPGSFERTCAELRIECAASVRFDDHHWYRPEDVRTIREAMTRHTCRQVLTTEKDLPKMPKELRADALALRVDLKLEEEERFWETLRSVLAENRTWAHENRIF